MLARAAEAAGEKRLAVLASVREAGAKQTGIPLIRLAEAPSPHPSEITHEGVNPVAYRLALNNGSQCGYCSVGFVMNMSEFLINNPRATKKEIESAFDGNICRCTGYRSILTGMKTFASNWSAEDEKDRMKCLQDPGSAAQRPGPLVIPFPHGARGPAQPVTSEGHASLGRRRKPWRNLLRSCVTIAISATVSFTETLRSVSTNRNSLPPGSSSISASFPNSTFHPTSETPP